MAEFEVPQPIICSSFEEPAQHSRLQDGQGPELLLAVRPAQEGGCADGAPAAERNDCPF